jgi:hypothetical protein
MFWLFNLYTVISVGGGVVGALIATPIFGKDNTLALGTTMIVVATICDLGIRIFNTRRAELEVSQGLFSPRRGGHIWFIPVWLIGAILTLPALFFH